jgi:hypothetical protein
MKAIPQPKCCCLFCSLARLKPPVRVPDAEAGDGPTYLLCSEKVHWHMQRTRWFGVNKKTKLFFLIADL